MIDKQAENARNFKEMGSAKIQLESEISELDKLAREMGYTYFSYEDINRKLNDQWIEKTENGWENVLYKDQLLSIQKALKIARLKGEIWGIHFGASSSPEENQEKDWEIEQELKQLESEE